MSTQPLLSCSDVSVAFGGVAALQGVSIHVDDGEAIGLLGPNGSGKTSLVNVISGYYRINSGTVHFGGRDIGRLAPQQIRALGVARVFQNIRLYSGLSVVDNVALGTALDLASVHGVVRGSMSAIFGVRRQAMLWRRSQSRAMDLLEENGLADIARVPAGQLSYGVAKIVEILRAIADEPRMLLLDEPTSGVAESDAGALRDQLVVWQERIGCAIVVVEHRMGWLRGLANRAYVLDGGVTIGEGSVDDVLADPKVVEAFVGG